MAPGPVNIFEYEALAKERLSKTDYDFIAGGATDEITIRRNRRVFDSIMLRPRVLVDVGKRDLSTTVLGTKISFPVMIDPAGGQGLAHPEAEPATARAAGSVGTLMVLSSESTRTLEEVSRAATGPIWFQQYLYRDRTLTLEMAQRADEAGYSAICVLVGASLKPKRERNIRNRQVMQASPNYAGLNLNPYSSKPTPGVPQGLEEVMDPSATWEGLDRLAADSHLPVLVKGIMTGEDARLCAENGAKAVIVSNAGGRYLDTAFATIEVLPEVAEAVDGRMEVYLDSGVRRGSDVFKALALGARAVLVGRAVFWGLAVDGEAGARAVLEILRDELDTTMGFCGCPTVDSINIKHVGAVSPLLSLFPQPYESRLHGD